MRWYVETPFAQGRKTERELEPSSMRPIRDLMDWFKSLSLAYKVTVVLGILVVLTVLGGEVDLI